MFDNSISVISSISRSLKKYLFIFGIVTQCLFIAYYTYLVVTNRETILLMSFYGAVLLFSVILLGIDIFTLDITSFKTKAFKTTSKRIINAFSWVSKAGVIGYNIYVTATHTVTEASKMFLIFSSVFLIVQIIASFFSWLLSYYSELLMYALKMDYENLIDEKDDPNERPIGQALTKFTNQKNHKKKVNELSVQHELFGSIKEKLEKENPIRFNGKIVKRKKAERIILHYIRKASKYYPSRKKTKYLIDVINTKLMKFVYNHEHAFLLEFFLHNYYDHIYVGLSEHAIKLIMGCFLYVLDDNNKDIFDVVYKALIKEIIDIKAWSAPDPHKEELSKSNTVGQKIDKALSIAKESKDQYELYKEETVGSEFESLIIKVVKDAVIENGRLMIKRKVRSFFRKDK